jgi:hypothetical protein
VFRTPAHHPVAPPEPEPHDEVQWMAIAIESLALLGALLFAVVQSA